MLNIAVFNNKGISLTESLVAALLAAVAIIALMPMQDMALKTGFKADYLGRATYIMQAELEEREYFIMNQDNEISTALIVRYYTNNGVSTASAAAAYFTVNITTTSRAANAWVVNVRVNWPGGPKRGINSSIIATRHYNF